MTSNKMSVFAGALVLLSCSIAGVRGSGTAAEESRTVPAFKRIEVKGSTDVTVTAGQAQKVVVSGDDNIVPRVRTRVQDDTLVIDMDEGSYSPRLKTLVTIKTPSLEGVTIKGSGDVSAHHVDAARFAAHISGSGDLEVSGKASELEASISGSGDMKLYDLATQRAEVEIRGSGGMHLNPSESLKASVSGSGDIRYKGSPKTDVKVRGSGSVKPG